MYDIPLDQWYGFKSINAFFGSYSKIMDAVALINSVTFVFTYSWLFNIDEFIMSG